VPPGAESTLPHLSRFFLFFLWGQECGDKFLGIRIQFVYQQEIEWVSLNESSAKVPESVHSPWISTQFNRHSPPYHTIAKVQHPPQVTVFLSLVALTFRLTVNFFRLSWPFRVFSFRFCLLSVCKFVLFHSDMRNDKKKKIRTQKRWQLGLADAIYQLMEGSFLNCWISKEKYKKPFHTHTSLETGLQFAHLMNHATI